LTVSPVKSLDGKLVGASTIARDITDRKQAEDALRRNEEQYRMLLETSMDAVAITVGTICVYVNKRYAEMLGFSDSSELIGQDFLEFIAPECRELVQDRTLRRERGEKVPALYEFMIQRKDGTRVPVETNAVAMQWEGKRATLAFRRDITERKRAEEATSRLAAIVESSNDAIIGRTLDMVITSWNKAAEKIFGYTEEEMIGKTLFIPAPPECENSKQTRERVQRGERVEHYETKRIRKDGKIINVSLTFSPIKTRTGEIVGTSQTARDITESKRLEEELKRHSDHLEELVHERTMMLSKSEMAANRLAEQLTALDATVLGITETTDLSGLVRSIVERAVDLLKVDGGELYLSAPERQEVRCVISYKTQIDVTGTVSKYGEGAAGTVAKTGQPLIINDYRTWPNRLAIYEHLKQFRAVLSVPLIWQGKVTGVINVGSRKESRLFNQDDLTLLTRFANHAAIAVQRKQMEDHLREVERLAAIGETAAMVGHDLRNPLQAIAGALHLLKQEPLTPNERNEMLQVIEKSLQYSDIIIRDLSDYSAEIRLNLGEATPRSITRDAIGAVKVPQNVLVQDLSEDQPILRVDPERMGRVFINLIQNAIDAMPEGGTLIISSKKSEGNVEITLTDTGSGIQENVMKNLGKPLQTTKAKGLGLGLAICKRILNAHGGNMSAKSQTGSTTLTIQLPIKPAEVKQE
ncbi:MAG TPA: PAS domain S-box protein, partial [Candidatus Bathyarchaeia archaeon]|nr:PAS domain S-box protein [Candidatus Bathyarchaeia archaeon]